METLKIVQHLHRINPSLLTVNKHGDECGDNAATVINNHMVVNTNQKQI